MTSQMLESDDVMQADTEAAEIAEVSVGTPCSVSTSIPRRHDLDALRAIAMLLGIALHGALAYVPMGEEGWSVNDAANSTIYGTLMAMIHGFRMPLFFLISGFFTAMLWRKRGLGALIMHRLKRIFLPLMIGVFTIVPLVWACLIFTGIRSGRINAELPPTIWQTARTGDAEGLGEFLKEGAIVNAREPATGFTPLSIASARGRTEMVSCLVEAGADVNLRNSDGGTPLHAAALMGQTEVVKQLLDQGARTDVRNRIGETPAEMVKVNGMRLVVAAGMAKTQLQAPPDRSEVSTLLAEADPNGVRIEPNDDAETFGMGGLILLSTLFPIFHHLWFLWFLCWLVAGFVIYAAVIRATGIRLPSWLVVSPLRYAWLIPITFVLQATFGLLYPNFGPDTSTGLIPMPTILIYYAIFFFFGAMYFDCDDRVGKLGKWWKITLPVALLVVFPIGYELASGSFGFTKDAWLDSGWIRPTAILLQVTYVWLMTFGLIGMFRALFSKESPTMRYISDSAYWMYLAHLPLIMVMQSIAQTWNLPSLAKLAFVCVTTSAILLVTYEWLVRYTPIGTMLNGPRTRPVIVEKLAVEPASN